jgi:sugar phosphate isomerase/epimerase
MTIPPNDHQQSYPPLAISGKKAFPFRLACPSFIHPAGYVENVRHLAPFVDEIELLFFESRFADSLPAPDLIRQLVQLSKDLDICYNIHLPTDIFLGHADNGMRQAAVDVLKEMVARCALLNPTTYTLHLTQRPAEPDIRQWQVRTAASIKTLLATGISGRCISVENLDYDFEQAAPIICQLGLSVCMDMGHLMVQGADIQSVYEKWQDRITMVHLHGVDGPQDHLPLNRLESNLMNEVMKLLRTYSGTVSLEVFAFEALDTSMIFLDEQWRR